MKQIAFVLGLLLVTACAMKPPVQEMAEARSAIHMAAELPGNQPKAKAYLKSAEQALEEAAREIDAEHFEHARRKALEAKRNAQQAARIKQANP
ncbi:MAG: DUF4398 domain-containing protein [Mariprofundaceae bacterium]